MRDKRRSSVTTSTVDYHSIDEISITFTCYRENLARLSTTRNPLSLLKLGAYSKYNLKKDLIIDKQIRTGSI